MPELRQAVAIKSNHAIAKELARAGGSLRQAPVTGCPNRACPQHGPNVTSQSKGYQRFGSTRSGSLRFRCKACRCVFTPVRRGRSQLKPHENKTVFKALVSKAPIRSIAYQADLHAQAVYAKIDFIHRQCLAFAAARLIGGWRTMHVAPNTSGRASRIDRRGGALSRRRPVTKPAVS